MNMDVKKYITGGEKTNNYKTLISGVIFYLYE